MTDEVAAIVLEDNRLQALALSIAESDAKDAAASYIRLIETLEATGGLDRATEGLADNETLSRRALDGLGLMRPELAVLLSSAKLIMQDAIEASNLAKDPAMERALITSFPEAMQSTFKSAIESHQLRGEMIATELANRIVNRMGMLAPFELAEEESVPLDFVASAFVAADGLYDVGAIWRMLDSAFEMVTIALRGQMADLLRVGAGKRMPSDVIAELAPAIAELREATGDLLAGQALHQSENLLAEMTAAGAPSNAAKAVIGLFDTDGSVGLAQLARDSGIAPLALTGAFSDLGMRMGLDWAQGTAALMEPSDVWERLLVAGLARDFQHMRLEFLRRLLRAKARKSDPAAAIAKWADENALAIEQFRAMVERAKAQPVIAPSMLAQIASQARNLLER
jgi:glutamate dehydrogenase